MNAWIVCAKCSAANTGRFKTHRDMLRLLIAVSLIAEPQVVCRLGPADAGYNAYSDQNSSPDALELAGAVNAALRSFCIPNCPRISMFRNTTASNLMLLRSSEQMKLVYNPAFFTTVYEASGDSAIMALLAHEVGHAIDGVARAAWMKSSWNSELRADAWAGCALGQMNLSKRSREAALTTLQKYPSSSHPEWNTRLSVIQVGYTQCSGGKN
jgi:hypothetical protein